MPHTSTIIYFDIAAVVIMLISLASLLLRGLTKGAANRVYLSAMVLVTLTACAALAGEIYDAIIGPSLVQYGPYVSEGTRIARTGVAMFYYALRSLTAPAYLVLIATISETSHKLNSNNLVRAVLWLPMIAILLLILTNPLHHLVFEFVDGVLVRKPLLMILYVGAVYYSIIGIAWLIRWRALLSTNEFVTLMMLYPIMLAETVIQYFVPELRLDMFVTSVVMLLVSAFAIHPETRHDNTVDAESLHSYHEMCSHAFATDKPLCLVYIEIVNMERLRELAGQMELQGIVRQVSKNLAARLERDDVLYYLRNGVFCISAHNLDPARAEEIAWAAHNEGRAASNAPHARFSIIRMRSCVVRVPEDAPDVETLRNLGRRLSHLVPGSTVTTFTELAKRDDFKLQMNLANILTRAIENRSFEVYYQPICHLADGRFHTAEALVRLNDPELGWVSPSLFIPEAENNGTIIAIGSILLEKICAFLGSVDFEGTGLEYVEVNLSVEQCVRPETVDEVLGLLEKNGVDPSHVNLEITETAATYSQKVIEENVRKLVGAGVAVSLDDYGTGYSNIARMLSMPFSLVKLDQSFVQHLDDPATRKVLADTIATTKAIGKATLMEGVETREQVEALQEMGVDYIQGYYYAKPMPEADFLAFLKEHNA
ncbi:MAG: EAL domain-containing protein [Eggerthellaceae bacterium]|nr:EAL domain-containing protein [Eggerthellaceae bacterium]